MNTDTKINSSYTDFYEQRNPEKVYPTEFVVRTFLAKYPKLKLNLKAHARVLDLGFGDGRNTAFLIEQGYQVCGIEITERIVELTKNRLNKLGLSCDLKVGRNSQIPYVDKFFDVVLACHASYYCDEDDSFQDNLSEISRVLKPGGYFITSLIDEHSYLFKDAIQLDDGCKKITSDPYNNRNGYKLRSFSNEDEIEAEFSHFFNDFSFGKAENNYYGIDERVFWVTCRKK
jgi:SAM-dependent methyltransferase